MEETKQLTGKKIAMTQIFTEDGTVVPVTQVLMDSVDGIEAGQKVTVKGVSKGKGFAGVVKRYSFAGGPKTHGQSDRHRAPGSIGQGTFPGRVWRGQKMPGRMGGENVTVKNLEVVAIKEGNNLFLKGAVPGARNSQVRVLVPTTTETNESEG